MSRIVHIAAAVRRHARPLAAAVAVCALGAGLLGAARAGSAADGRTVKTEGGEEFVPNAKIMSNLKFAPGNLTVASGETLTLDHADRTDEPHTLSIVNAGEVPGDLDAVFSCGEPGTVCDDVFTAFGSEPSSSLFVNGPGTGSGIDGRLDSLFVLPGDSISATVTAPSGSTLYFICAIHPWMQGTINVK